MLEREELIKRELSLVPPKLPSEPYAIKGGSWEEVTVIVGDDEGKRLTLSEALERLIDFEEERSKDLAGRLEKTVKRRRHGSGHPRPKREKTQVRKLHEGEMRKRPHAKRHLLIKLILESSPDKPPEIFPGPHLFDADKKPPQKEIDPSFYTFICNRPAAKAVEILDNPNHLKTLWKHFWGRRKLWEAYHGRNLVLGKNPTWTKVTDRLLEYGRDEFGANFNFPPELMPLIKEISGIFELHRNAHGSTRDFRL